MKQFVFGIEVILTSDDSELIIVRDPRGQVVKTLSNPSELSSFLIEAIAKIKNQSENGKE